MNYRNSYLPAEYVGELKRVILKRVQELGKIIFDTAKPSHENESEYWSKYLALLDVYLCLEGAEKNGETISLTTFNPSDDRQLIMHPEAKFEFRLDDDKEG